MNFNSRAHVERDRNVAVSAAETADFNSRAHVERDVAHRKAEKRRFNFNSRAHVERDKMVTASSLWFNISTHALTWSATLLSCAALRHRAFQLTRSRGARLAPRALPSQFGSVFQLTRSRGARPCSSSMITPCELFQLTRSRGARRDSLSLCRENQKISTHALTWSATVFPHIIISPKRISTHALTWSATEQPCIDFPHSCDFNSRAHVERDEQRNGNKGNEVEFQLTRSRGARPANIVKEAAEFDFNSRAHVERD